MVFWTWYGHFKHQVMLFELSNASASLQDYINKILIKKHNIFVIFYLDDIFIHVKDLCQAHINAVWWVLEKLKKHGLFAKLKKCQFHKDQVHFLRYVVSSQGVQMEDEKIKKVKNWPEPKSVQDIQVFLGFANIYWCFI